MLQCAAACCSVLWCVAVCSSAMLQMRVRRIVIVVKKVLCCSVLQCVLQCVAVCWQCDAVCWQCVAVFCSVLQCVAV